MNKQLEKIIKEELDKFLKENTLHPKDTEGHINQAKIEMILKKLNKNAFNHPGARDQSLYETDRGSWIMGYQKALKEVAEELLGLIF